MQFVDYDILDEHAKIAIILSQYVSHVDLIDDNDEVVGIVLNIDRYEQMRAGNK